MFMKYGGSWRLLLEHLPSFTILHSCLEQLVDGVRYRLTAQFLLNLQRESPEKCPYAVSLRQSTLVFELSCSDGLCPLALTP